jgi:glutamine amidotransferase
VDEPFTYRVPTMPGFDRNLRGICRKLAPSSVLAHVRGVTWGSGEVISDLNLHPFQFPGAKVVMAHNGHLRDFEAMRYDLLPHLRPGLSRHIAGTTDSEWIYALLLSQLDDPAAAPDAGELTRATIRVLEILRDVRARHGIDTSSPVNLFMATGECLVATRFVLDYGWYPDDDPMLEVDVPYVSLWYTAGRAYAENDGAWEMLAAHGRPESLLIASEPLTTDTSTWLEVPEYSLLRVSRGDDGLEHETIPLDV